MAKVFFACIGYTLLPFILILKELDSGSPALVFLAISLAMMFVAGVPKRMLAGLVGRIWPRRRSRDWSWRFSICRPNSRSWNPFQKDRVPTYLGREQIQGRQSSYNVEQALISVGSGGLAGKRLEDKDSTLPWISPQRRSAQ